MRVMVTLWIGLTLGVSVTLWDDAVRAEERRSQSVAAATHEASKGGLEVELLAKEFGVPPTIIEGLREKYGWGAITVQLVMAQHLLGKHPDRYHTLPEALVRIEQLRAQGTGWGKMAQDLDLPLAPVVREVQRVRQELRAGRKSVLSSPEAAALDHPETSASHQERLRQELRPPTR